MQKYKDNACENRWDEGPQQASTLSRYFVDISRTARRQANSRAAMRS